MFDHHRASRRRGGLLLLWAALCAPALADPISLAPTLAGHYRAGTGVDAIGDQMNKFLKGFSRALTPAHER